MKALWAAGILWAALSLSAAAHSQAVGSQTAEAGLGAEPQTACDRAIANLEYTRQGYNAPLGAQQGYERLRSDRGYLWSGDAPLFAFDAYREHGDVRANCPKEEWPASVTPEGLKAIMAAGMPTKKRVLCGDETWQGPTAARQVMTWLANPDVRGFKDRVKELQGQLDATNQNEQSAARRASDAEWLRDASRELVGLCTPSDEVKAAVAAAETALAIARENMAFVACVDARKAMQPQIQAFDAAAKTGDVALMKAALTSLEAASNPVLASCASSEEGRGETAYIIASKKMQILFREAPTCMPAAQAMNGIRQSLNGADKADRPKLIADLRASATASNAACGNDPAPEAWGMFVAWVAERNLTRIP